MAIRIGERCTRGARRRKERSGWSRSSCAAVRFSERSGLAARMHNPDPVPDEPIRFNSALDVEAAARAFAQRGRARIADVLDPLSAARLYGCLEADVPWNLAYNEGEKSVFLDAA